MGSVETEGAKRKCIGVDCENDAGTLQCPTCLKLGIKDSFFCSQDCFKRSWVSSLPAFPSVWLATKVPPTDTPQSTHKAIHKSKSNFLSNFITPKVVSEPHPDTGIYDPFPTFPYTGPLRAVYPLSETRKVPKSIPHPDYWKDGVPISENTYPGRTKIEILDKKGQEGMRKVCRLAREVLDIAAAAAVPGVTTDYIDEVVHNACLERNVCATSLTAMSLLTSAVIPVAPQLRQLPQISMHIR